MLDLPTLNKFDLKNKKVIVRMDLDTSEGDTTRIEAALPTLNYLLQQNSKIIIIGHKGRPEGVDESLSLKSMTSVLEKFLNKKVNFETDGEIVLKENLRFDKGEVINDLEFTRKLASLGDFYVNEAFATSHRADASIVGLPKLLPHAAGQHFVLEIDNLSKLLENPRRPFIVLISGIKKDKLDYIESFKSFADKILVGGRLPEFLGDNYEDQKVVVAKLNPDKEDITIHSIEIFQEEIKRAGTIVLAGVIGKYEDTGQRLGTEKIFKAIAASNAFKVVGGGDSEAALAMFDLKDKFDWISVGGGAMLEFLAKKTLPGIEALLQ